MIGGEDWVGGEMRGNVGGRGGSSHFTFTLTILYRCMYALPFLLLVREGGDWPWVRWMK